MLQGDRSEIVRMPDMQWRSALNPDILSVLMVAPDRMSLLHLSAYVKHLSKTVRKPSATTSPLVEKIGYPLAALVMVALALPFGYTHNRSRWRQPEDFLRVMIGAAIHMLNGLFSNLGAINSWSPALSAIPSALFMLAAVA